jgi:hypothetical protein
LQRWVGRSGIIVFANVAQGPAPLTYAERVLITAADIQGQEPPGLLPDRADDLLTSVPTNDTGTPARRDQLLQALQDLESNGWMRLLKVMGPWSWVVTQLGLDVAGQLRARAGSSFAAPTLPIDVDAPVFDLDLSPDQSKTLQLIFDVFLTTGKWPVFQYVERELGGSEGFAQKTLTGLGDSLIVSAPSPRAENWVKLTARGVAYCRGSRRVIDAYLWLVRWLVKREAEFTLPTPTEKAYARVNSAEAESDWLGTDTGRSAADLRLAYELTETDPRLYEQRSQDGGGWSMEIGTRIRPYRQVVTFEDYLEVRSLDEGAVLKIPIPFENPVVLADQIVDIAHSHTIPGFAPDVSSPVDQLGLEAEVFAFADLILARDVVPPLALGVFGPWGSGKTTFMSLLRQRLEVLARAVRDAPPNDRLKAYCEDVIHIDFNAWHYTEANLWASLVTRIFERLTVWLDAQAKQGIDYRERLFQQLRTSQDLVAEAQRRVDAASALRAQAQERLAGNTKSVVDAQRVLASSTLAEFSSANPLALGDARQLASSLGLETGSLTLAQVGEIAGRTRTAFGYLATWWRLPGRSKWRIGAELLLPILVAMALFGVAMAVNALSLKAVAVGVGAIAIVVGIRWFSTPLSRAIRLAGRLVEREETANELMEVMKGEDDARAALVRAQSDLSEAEQEVERIKKVDSGSMYGFVSERYGSADYQRQLGTVAMVQRDLQQLSEILSGKRSQQEGTRMPRADRIVLYIDDLDRCPRELVLKVLEAVHLLLAYPLFVVVVGVDVHWLYESIRNSRPNGGDSSDAELVPLRYVEKIFQVPYWLRPLSVSAYRSLIDAVLTGPEPLVSRGTPQDEPHDQSVPEPRSNEPEDHAADGHAAEGELPISAGTVTSEERYVLHRLAAFVDTPRAAKRLANVYRLLKVLVGPAARPAFDEGGFAAVLIELAIASGFPDLSPYVFRHILNNPQRDFWELMRELRPLVALEAAQSNPVRDAIDPHEAARWRALVDATLSLKSSFVISQESFAAWAPLTQRFSFAGPSTYDR